MWIARAGVVMPTAELAMLAAAILTIAFLYSSVGHAGASGYLAVLALAGLAPAEMKPVALTLNVIVATVGTAQFMRAGHFDWRLFWPFALTSVPFAFFGGALSLPSRGFHALVGLVLLLSAARFLMRPTLDGQARTPSVGISMVVGGALGLLAGLTGTGGGIFLTPVLLFTRWADTRRASATSVLFILVNSLAGLAGSWSATHAPPSFVWPLGAAALAGGAVGSTLGSRVLPPRVIQRMLAIVLLIAGLKLLTA